MNFARILVAAVILACSAIGVHAQGTQVAFGGLKQDPSLPVEISADKLNVNQTDGNATFTGNVVIGQGEMRLAAPKVFVEYSTAEGEKTAKISRIHATGGVTMVSGAEAAESREAEYTIEDGMVVMIGDVILTQGANAMSSDRMVVNLITGVANMDGRVRSVFKTEEN